MNPLDLTPEELRSRYALLCRSTRAQPDRRLLPTAAQDGLAVLSDIVEEELDKLALADAPQGYPEFRREMRAEMDRLWEFCAYPHLGERFIVAVGGGFSAGKSSLINTLLGQRLLVTEIDPTTSLPTYLMHGEESSISALNLFGNRVSLSEQELATLTHDEVQIYGTNVSRLLRSVFVTRADFPWQQLALVDTPGYTRHEDQVRSERTDERIARSQLRAAQAIIWVISASQGCITEDDLQFLEQLDGQTPKLIVITRADQKSTEDITAIVATVEQSLQARGLAVEGIVPVSNRKPRDWPLDAVRKQLAAWSARRRPLRFAENFDRLWKGWEQAFTAQISGVQQQLALANGLLSLVPVDNTTLTTQAQAAQEQAQRALTAAKERLAALQNLRQQFFEHLQGVGDAMGLDLGVKALLAALEKTRREALKRAERERHEHQETQAQRVRAAAPRAPSPGDILQDGPDLPALVVIPAGSFRMGGNSFSDEQPVHTVHIQSFALGKFPVTQGQWKAVMGNNPSDFKGEDDLPVENVSWNDAQAFIQKLRQRTGHAYRLPSEAEWEYACRAGSTGDWCFGDDEGRLGHWAWYDANSEGRTHPVGQKKINAFGLYDMHGNVWEWCEDHWHDSYNGAPTDGAAWLGGGNSSRVLRGGSWYFISRNTRSAYRGFFSAVNRDSDVGFRLARTL